MLGVETLETLGAGRLESPPGSGRLKMSPEGVSRSHKFFMDSTIGSDNPGAADSSWVSFPVSDFASCLLNKKDAPS